MSQSPGLFDVSSVNVIADIISRGSFEFGQLFYHLFMTINWHSGQLTVFVGDDYGRFTGISISL